MSKIPQISEAEFEVMEILWSNGPISTNDVVKQLSRTREWSPKTIQTLLIRLEKKKAITHTKEGRIYIYSPLVRRQDYLNSESHTFLDRFYKGSLDKMVMHFIDQDMLSDQDIEELRQLLERHS